VLHRSGDACLRIEEGRYVASRIPGARFVELPGADHLPFVADQESILNEIERFVTGLHEQPDQELVLATMLFLIKRSHVAPEVWSQFEICVRREIEWFGGRGLAAAGVALAATFDGPARAIRCACSILQCAVRMDIRIGIGLHTGECERLPSGEMRGVAADMAVHIARRAGAGELLVSRTVRDLVAGSPFKFDRGDSLSFSAELGEISLFRVRSSPVRDECLA
jgi:hypothetical protein